MQSFLIPAQAGMRIEVCTRSLQKFTLCVYIHLRKHVLLTVHHVRVLVSSCITLMPAVHHVLMADACALHSDSVKMYL
jgi:hypothetical protein